jgi:hypothetical protein
MGQPPAGDRASARRRPTSRRIKSRLLDAPSGHRQAVLFAGASSAESCIPKAVAERGLTRTSSALRMQRQRTKPLRGGATAGSPMGIEWPDSMPPDAPGGPFGLMQGRGRGRVDVAMPSVRTPAKVGRVPPLGTVPAIYQTLTENVGVRRVKSCIACRQAVEH